MEHIDYIIQQLIDNFNFAYMIIINLITYFIIRIIDYLNKDKSISTLIKRIILVITIVIAFIVYKSYTDISSIVLINSSILAPVFWSWVLKPICKKFGLTYKKFDNYIN